MSLQRPFIKTNLSMAKTVFIVHKNKKHFSKRDRIKNKAIKE
jgi:hypothetical protein